MVSTRMNIKLARKLFSLSIKFHSAKYLMAIHAKKWNKSHPTNNMLHSIIDNNISQYFSHSEDIFGESVAFIFNIMPLKV